MIGLGLDLAERGRLPDFLIEWGIRRLCAKTAADARAASPEALCRKQQEFIDELRRSPVALHVEKANEQHYEVPPEFFTEVLGKRRKYSSCYFASPTATLDEAEETMLAMYGERAQLADGQRILELGCGWGSLTLWMAEHYPNAKILAVSNSAPQRGYIESECRKRSLSNVEIVTADMNEFSTERKFDRVVSIEMFEHMRNYAELHRRISGWLDDAGKLFVHIFCHRSVAYPFETEGDENWMGRHFFTGGIMPSADLLPRFQEHLTLEHQWAVDGTHYERTSYLWLENLDSRKDRVMPILAAACGEANASRMFHRWRIFFLACAGLFGLDRGREWYVAHYRFAKGGRNAY